MSDELLNIQSFRSIDSLPISETTPEFLDETRVRAHIARATERRRYQGDADPRRYLLERRCQLETSSLSHQRVCFASGTTRSASSHTRRSISSTIADLRPARSM